MKATQLKRIGSAMLAAGLLAGILTSAASADSSTRIVSIGSTTDCTAALTSNGAPGTLDPSTPVTVGGLIRVDVAVENCGGQNLSNAQVTVGDPQAVTAGPATAFADGSIFDSVSDTTACKGTNTGLLTCSYKSLRPSKPVTFTAYVKAATETTLHITAVVLFNEGTNTTGSNPQTFVASGPVAVGATTCDTFATYLSPSRRSASLCGVTDPDNGNHQSTSVKLLSTSLTSALVDETSSGPTCTAPNGLACFGDYSNATIPTTSGDILEWTMVIDLTYTGNTNLNVKKLIIYHWYDDPTFNGGTGFVELDNTSAFNCKTRPEADGCIVSVTKSSGGILTVIFRTPANGSTKLLG